MWHMRDGINVMEYFKPGKKNDNDVLFRRKVLGSTPDSSTWIFFSEYTCVTH